MQPSVHDLLFKAVFSDPRHASGALQSALPTALAARVDWSTLALEPGSFVDETLRGLGGWVDLVREVCAAPNGAAALAVVWRYILLIHEEKPEVVLLQLGAVTPEQGRQEAMMTAGEVLMERGRVQGELRGRRAMLLELLAERFGTLPVWAAARLEAADLVQLNAWGRRVLKAASLDEVLGKAEKRAERRSSNKQEAMMTAGEVLMARGELQGQRRMLTKQLTVRFGALPVWVMAKLEGAAADQLDVWAERILTAASLEEALG